MKVTPASSAAWMTRIPWSSGGRSWIERCIPPYPTAGTRGAPGPRLRRGIMAGSNESSEAELLCEPVPVAGRNDAFVHEGGERSKNVRAAAVDAAVAQL